MALQAPMGAQGLALLRQRELATGEDMSAFTQLLGGILDAFKPTPLANGARIEPPIEVELGGRWREYLCLWTATETDGKVVRVECGGRCDDFSLATRRGLDYPDGWLTEKSRAAIREWWSKRK